MIITNSFFFPIFVIWIQRSSRLCRFLLYLLIIFFFKCLFRLFLLLLYNFLIKFKIVLFIFYSWYLLRKSLYLLLILLVCKINLIFPAWLFILLSDRQFHIIFLSIAACFIFFTVSIFFFFSFPKFFPLSL